MRWSRCCARHRTSSLPYCMAIVRLQLVLQDTEADSFFLAVWAGNIASKNHSKEPIIFDACSYFGHNEADFGISVYVSNTRTLSMLMIDCSMFGGFSSAFFEAYHAVIPRLEPHYRQRQDLYKLFHQLNHAAMFGMGGYGSSAMSNCKQLLSFAQGQG